jgi:hypothetical protein
MDELLHNLIRLLNHLWILRSIHILLKRTVWDTDSMMLKKVFVVQLKIHNFIGIGLIRRYKFIPRRTQSTVQHPQNLNA